MREDLDKKLVEKYPKIFADHYKSPQESCMYWGFECNDGWYNLIDHLCISIQHYLDYNLKIPQVIASQVKEKFGTLCFYFCGGDSYVRGLVDMVSCLSGSTCEICGNPGKIQNYNWIKVRCDKCLEPIDEYFLMMKVDTVQNKMDHLIPN